MPGWLRGFARVTPSPTSSPPNAGSSGNASAAEIAWVLIAAAVLTLVFAPLTVHLYARERWH